MSSKLGDYGCEPLFTIKIYPVFHKDRKCLRNFSSIKKQLSTACRRPIVVFHFRAYVTDTEPIPARGSPEDGQCRERKYEKSEIEDMLPRALSVFHFSYTICNNTLFNTILWDAYVYRNCFNQVSTLTIILL